MQSLPPKAPKPSYTPVHKSRWEKEKLAAGDEHAFDNPNDPDFLGHWHIGEMVGKGASGESCSPTTHELRMNLSLTTGRMDRSGQGGETYKDQRAGGYQDST